MSRAATSRRWPRAHATCDRCGFRFNHDQLQWQFQWVGPRLQNLRILVCQSCLDVPQEQLRIITLPPDPVPIENPRPEDYVSANNPNSPIGQAPLTNLLGTNIGTLTKGGTTYAAFDENRLKTFAFSANLVVSNAGYENWVGKNWSVPPYVTYGALVDSGLLTTEAGVSLTAEDGSNLITENSVAEAQPVTFESLLDSQLRTSTLKYVASSFRAIAPTDTAFLTGMPNPLQTEAGDSYITEGGSVLVTQDSQEGAIATGYRFEGSQDGQNWTIIASGTTGGTIGEILSVTLGGRTPYQYHRFNLNGDGLSMIAVAQLEINTDRGNLL